MPPASASRCRLARCARRWRCAPTCSPKASRASGATRSSTLLALLNRRVHPRRAEPRLGRRQRRPRAARPPRARAHRRRIRDRRRRDPGAAGTRGARGRRSPPITLEAKEGLALINGTQPSTAVAALALAGAERLARAAGHRRRAVDRCAARLGPSVRRAHPCGAAARGPAHLGRQHPRAARGQRHQQVARALRPRAGRLLAALRGAGPRRGARRARVSCAQTLADRGQRRHRQPDGLRRQTTRSCRAETFTARRSRSPPICWRSRSAQLATISERRSDRLVNPALSEPAGVPDAGQRPAVRLHDGAGDRRRAGVGDQDARASGERRHDSRPRPTAKTTSA